MQFLIIPRLASKDRALPCIITKFVIYRLHTFYKKDLSHKNSRPI